MSWIVSLMLSNGRIAVVTVVAFNRHDAEYRAAYKAECIYKENVIRAVRAVRG